eukprot:4518693-Pyramimonas_sp.AAC.1
MMCCSYGADVSLMCRRCGADVSLTCRRCGADVALVCGPAQRRLPPAECDGAGRPLSGPARPHLRGDPRVPGARASRVINIETATAQLCECDEIWDDNNKHVLQELIGRLYRPKSLKE